MELLGIGEIHADERIAAVVVFDLDDIEAAIAELDARYLAGEAAAHAHTWSVIVQAYAAINMHQSPATTLDWVNVDHRRLPTAQTGDMSANLRAGWDITTDFSIYIEAVQRLSNLGAVITHKAYGTSHEGVDAEWRAIDLLTIDGGLINRGEIFDEADIDAAIARFEELNSRTPRLENAASQVVVRYQACFSGRDWDAMGELLADDIVTDDRRRVVNAGVREGRDTHIADLRAAAEVGAENFSSSVIATRGQRLALARVSTRNRSFDEIGAEILGLGEINADNRFVRHVVFDVDDIDAAFEELDARYVRGEGAAHAHTWSVMARSYAAANRRELPPTTSDYIIVDHRLQHESRGLTDYLQASWDLIPDLRMYIEAVHRLSDDAGVVTLVLHGASQEGFDAEWRVVEVLTREGDMSSRYRDIRRGRPRRRAREIRRARSASTAAGKRGYPSNRTRPGIPHGP